MEVAYSIFYEGAQFNWYISLKIACVVCVDLNIYLSFVVHITSNLQHNVHTFILNWIPN